MGCGFDLGDDYDKCQILLDEYADLLTRETEEKSNDASIIVNYEQEKEELKLKIKKKLEYINENAENLAQIDRLQKLNEKFQMILTDESKMKE